MVAEKAVTCIHRAVIAALPLRCLCVAFAIPSPYLCHTFALPCDAFVKPGVAFTKPLKAKRLDSFYRHKNSLGAGYWFGHSRGAF